MYPFFVCSTVGAGLIECGRFVRESLLNSYKFDYIWLICVAVRFWSPFFLRGFFLCVWNNSNIFRLIRKCNKKEVKTGNFVTHSFITLQAWELKEKQQKQQQQPYSIIIDISLSKQIVHNWKWNCINWLKWIGQMIWFFL